MPGVRTNVQSDGSVVNYRVIGDELLNYMIDSNGNLLKYGDDGDIYYAEWISESEFLKNTSGNIAGYVVPTKRKPIGVSPNTATPSESDMRPLNSPIPKYILDNIGKILEERHKNWIDYQKRSRIQSSQGIQAMSVPVTITERNLLIIYVRFEDEDNMPEIRNMEISNQDIHNYIFNEARQGSVAHYYSTVTDGKVKFNPARETQGTNNDGIIRVTVPGRHLNWGTQTNNNAFRTNVILPALEKAAPFIDYRNFTSNNNLYGYNLSILFIVHGYETAVGGAPGVWAHADSDLTLATYNGVAIKDYCTIGAFHGSNATPRHFTMGISARVLGNNALRFFSLYDIGGNRTIGVSGTWSLMGQGTWGSVTGEQSGTTPTALDAYHLSLLCPPTFTVSAADLELEQHFSLTGSHQFVKLETTFPNQYFLLQPRGNVGYDRGVFRYASNWAAPYGGLIIYHIDEGKIPWEVNPIWQDHPFFSIMEAHGGAPHLAYDRNYGTHNDLFYGNRDRFTDRTDPNSNLFASSTAITRNVASDVSITEITPNVTGQNTAGGSVTVEFKLGTIAPPVVTTTSLPDGEVGTAYNQTLIASGTIPITWDISSGSLPTGLSLNTASGAITGTPTVAGTFNFTVRATNVIRSATRDLSIVIIGTAADPTITTTSLPGGTIDVEYNQTLKATGTTPISWSIASGSLPTGLSLNATTGAITGKPTTTGTFNFTVSATNSVGDATKALSIVISEPGEAPIITTSELPDGNVRQAYSQTLSATGTPPITWSISSGRLPNGLSLNVSTGVISGSPTVAGTFNFTIRATNSGGSGTKAFSITISGIPIIATTTLPGGIKGKNYSQRLTATGSTPITWSISSGSLPVGMILNATTGAITGIPTETGSYSFKVMAENSEGNATCDLSILVTEIPIITTLSLPGGIVGLAYNQTLTATGTTPITWSISSRVLPEGLSLNEATGVISGTPTTAGKFTFSARATNVSGNHTKSFTITVTAIPHITTTSLIEGVVGKSYSQRFTAAGSTPITWSILDGSLPDGLNLVESTGSLTGRPTEEGTYCFTVRAMNSSGNDTKSFSILITEIPTVTTSTLPGGIVGLAYSEKLTATGTTPITWSITGGTLPTGLSFNESTGVISGTPTATGTFSFTVRAANDTGNGTKSLKIVVTSIPVITTPSLPGGIVGKSYNQKLSAAGTTPITWSISNGTLPNGLVLNETTGTITGIPTAMGTSSFTVRAANASGSGTSIMSINITEIPTIETATLPGGIVGQSYSQTLKAAGTTPMTWTIATGKLPTDLSLNEASGVISGTPSAMGTFNFTIRATNSAGNSTKALSIVVTAVPIITTDSLSGGTVGKSYNQTLKATGTTPITWAISSGALPGGLNLNTATGAITGTPTVAGEFSFTVRATNSTGNGTRNLSILIAEIPAVVTPSLIGGIVGQSYSETLKATGTTPITWSISSGKLPAGLSLNETSGMISGTPTTMGTFSFTVKATNLAGFGTKALSIVITAPPTITTTTLSAGTVGRSYSQTLKATGTTPITWAIAGGALPTGLNLNATTGAITGTATAAGTFNFTVRATNSAGNSTGALSIVIN